MLMMVQHPHPHIANVVDRCACCVTGQEVEEGDSEEEVEDIFELEGLTHELHLDPEAYAAQMHMHINGTYMQEQHQGPRGGWEGNEGNAGGVAETASTSGRPAVDESADKLDSMMELTFAHISRRCEAGLYLDALWYFAEVDVA